MKKIKSLGSLVILSWAIILGPLVAAPGLGCKNPGQSAYRAAGTVQVSADVAMKAWGVYVREKHPGVEVERKVEVAFNRYVAAMTLVADAGAALARSENQDTKTKLDIALAAASSALGDLTALVQLLGAKIN